MNMRNGIPIADYAPKKRQQATTHQLWKAEVNPYMHYVEMSMVIDGIQASIVMPAKNKWIQKYKNEGWEVMSEWRV